MSEDKSVLENSVSGIKWMSIASLTTTFVNFFITIVLARLLTADDYGAFQAIAVLVGFADMLWALGIGPALIRKKDLQKEDINTGHTINVIMGIIIFIVINVASSFWCDLFAINSESMLHIYSFIFIINTFLAVPKSILYRQYKYNIVSIASIIGVFVNAVLGVVFASIGFGAWALIISSLAQYLIQIVIVIPYSGIKMHFMISKKSLKELIYFGGGYSLMQFFNYIALQGDNYIVNKFLGSSALGNYGKAYNMMGYPANLVGQTIDQVMYPILSKIQDDKKRMAKIFVSETCFIGIVVVPIICVGVICSKELVSFLLGNGWDLVIVPMAIMVMTLFFRTAYKLNYTVLKTLGRVYIMSSIQLIYALSVLIGGYIGHYNGIIGVATGTSVAIIINYGMSLGVVIFELKINSKEIIKSYIAPVVYMIVMMTITFFAHSKLQSILQDKDFLLLVLITVFVFALYALLYKVTKNKLVPEQSNEYLNRLGKMIVDKLKKLKIKLIVKR